MKRSKSILAVALVVCLLVWTLSPWWSRWVLSNQPVTWKLARLLFVGISTAIVSWVAIRGRGRLADGIRKFLSHPPTDAWSERILDQYSFLRKHREIIGRATGGEIRSINITLGNGANLKIQRGTEVGAFKRELAGIRICLARPKAISEHGGEGHELRLEIETEEETVSYPAIVLPIYPDDIILTPPENSDYGGIRLVGLKRWLDENVLSKQE